LDAAERDHRTMFQLQPSTVSSSIDEEVKKSLDTLYYAKMIHLEGTNFDVSQVFGDYFIN
jgi:hypothetical protein